MNNVATCKVQDRGYITVPLAVREKLKLKRGETLAFIMRESGKIEVEKVAAGAKDIESVIGALEEMEKSLKAKGITLDELMQTGREERRKMFAEMYPDLA